MADDVKPLNIKWYLAGPMSNLPEHNYPAFTQACVRLREVGLNVVSPHETLPCHDDTRYLECLRHDAASMLTCEGIILLPGWSKSTGARFEFQIALTLGLQIRYFKDDILRDIT